MSDIHQCNLAVCLQRAAAQWPKRTALWHGTRRLTFAELEHSSRQAAALLSDHGVGRGDRVGLQLPNVPAFASFYYGALWLGAVLVPISTRLTSAERGSTLERAGARLNVVGRGLRDSGMVGLGAEREIVVHDFDAAHLLERQRPVETMEQIDGDATAVLVYSARTTGIVRGVELTHDNLRINALLIADLWSLSERDVIFGAVPLHRSYGQTCTLNAALLSGASTVVATRFEPRLILDLIERTEVTVLPAAPSLLAALLSELRDRSQMRSVRLCSSGGAPLPLPLSTNFERATGVTVLEGYGLAETSPVAASNRLDDRRPGTIGKPLNGIEMRIADEDDAPLGPGIVGEIQIRGHNVMKGYWNDPVATRAAITADRWLHTGDLGVVDADGFFRVVGRVAEIACRGRQPFPSELESIARTPTRSTRPRLQMPLLRWRRRRD